MFFLSENKWRIPMLLVRKYRVNIGLFQSSNQLIGILKC